MEMKRTVNIDIPQAQRSYSAQAVMQLLKITSHELRALENSGKLRLSSRDGSVPGYSGEGVDALIRRKNQKRR